MAEFWQTIRLLIINPPKAWRYIKKQEHSFRYIFWKKICVIVVISALANFVGESLSTANTASYLYISLKSSLFLVYNILVLYVLSLILNAILPNYGGKKNLPKVANLIIYSFTLYYFVISVIFIFPSLYFLYIFLLYCFFIFWYGVKQMLNLEEENKLGFFIVSIILIIGIYTIFYFVFNEALLRLFE